MALYGVSFTLSYVAWDTSAGAGKTGDVSNHTLRWIKDGTAAAPSNSPSEVDATNAPGVYKLALTAAEAQAVFGTLVGKSSTANVSIMPVSVAFERLPNAAPGADGGLPTVDANNRVAGVQGTITTLDALDTAQDAQHSTTQSAITDLNDFDGTGATLHTDYDAAKTAAQAGNAMALTAGERTTLAAAIEAAIINELDGQAVMQAIADLIADDMTTGDLTVQAIASAVRDAILDRVLAGNHDGAGSAGKVLQDVLTDTGTTLPATLSAIDGKIDTVDGVADSILEDTGTTLPATLAGLSTFNPTSDTTDGVTYEVALKAIMAAVFGKTALPDGSTVQFKGRDGSTVVVTNTYSANAGERLTSVIA